MGVAGFRLPYLLVGLNLRPIMQVEEAKAKIVSTRKRAGERLRFDLRLCFECGACVGVCPHDSLALTGLGIEIDHDTCTLCNACVRTCPTGAFAI